MLFKPVKAVDEKHKLLLYLLELRGLLLMRQHIDSRFNHFINVDNISAAITSSTRERKSRCSIFVKNQTVLPVILLVAIGLLYSVVPRLRWRFGGNTGLHSYCISGFAVTCSLV